MYWYSGMDYLLPLYRLERWTIMARTIFGIFNEILMNKKIEANRLGLPFVAEITDRKVINIASAYKVSVMCIKIARELWKMQKFNKNALHKISQLAIQLSPKDKVFPYNSCVEPKDMAFKNNPHNWGVCCGKNAVDIALASHALGVFSAEDQYFFFDKDFGFMSFNEIRSVELSGAMETWVWKQTKGE